MTVSRAQWVTIRDEALNTIQDLLRNQSVSVEQQEVQRIKMADAERMLDRASAEIERIDARGTSSAGRRVRNVVPI